MENRRRITRQKQEVRRQTDKFYYFIILFFSIPRHGTATAPQRKNNRPIVKDREQANKKAIKWEEQPPSLKSCSIGWNRGDAAQFYFSAMRVLHESLGGATASQQRQGYITVNRRVKIRKNKGKCGSERKIFIILFFTHK